MNRVGVAAGAILLAVGIGGAGATIGSLVEQAPETASRLRNPFQGNRQAERAGAKLYARECAPCHGLNREGGDKAPPLDQPEVHESSPGKLFWVLRNGSLRRGMPSFAHLPEAQRWQIVTFLRSRPGH